MGSRRLASRRLASRNDYSSRRPRGTLVRSNRRATSGPCIIAKCSRPHAATTAPLGNATPQNTSAAALRLTRQRIAVMHDERIRMRQRGQNALPVRRVRFERACKRYGYRQTPSQSHRARNCYVSRIGRGGQLPLRFHASVDNSSSSNTLISSPIVDAVKFGTGSGVKSLGRTHTM